MNSENVKIKFSGHALQWMFERNIQKIHVIEAVKSGDIIQNYPNDKPYPSAIKLTIINNRPLHVVSAYNKIENEIYIVTVYIPDITIWADDFKTRRK